MTDNHGGAPGGIPNRLSGLWERGFRQISEAAYPNGPADRSPEIHLDWQGWCDGNAVKIDALLCENIFTGPDPRAYEVRGHKPLSDHDGLLVHYRLRWMPEAEAATI